MAELIAIYEEANFAKDEAFIVYEAAQMAHIRGEIDDAAFLASRAKVIRASEAATFAYYKAHPDA